MGACLRDARADGTFIVHKEVSIFSEPRLRPESLPSLTTWTKHRMGCQCSITKAIWMSTPTDGPMGLWANHTSLKAPIVDLGDDYFLSKIRENILRRFEFNQFLYSNAKAVLSTSHKSLPLPLEFTSDEFPSPLLIASLLWNWKQPHPNSSKLRISFDFTQKNGPIFGKRTRRRWEGVPNWED